MMTVRRRFRTAGVLVSVVFLAVWVASPRPLRPSTLLLGTAVGSLLVILGLAMARPLCGVAPILEGSIASGEAMRRIGLAIFLGAVFGAFLLGILVFVLVPLEPALAVRLRSRAAAPGWLPWALATEASILEEVVFRLFLFTLVVWLSSQAWRGAVPATRPSWVWSANVISALAFAAAHLPAWLGAVQPSGLLIGSVLLLNALGGIVLGHVYWRWGIESAIALHFTADLVVQGLGPRMLV